MAPLPPPTTKNKTKKKKSTNYTTKKPHPNKPQTKHYVQQKQLNCASSKFKPFFGVCETALYSPGLYRPKSPGFTCFCFPNTGLKEVCYHTGATLKKLINRSSVLSESNPHNGWTIWILYATGAQFSDHINNSYNVISRQVDQKTWHGTGIDISQKQTDAHQVHTDTLSCWENARKDHGETASFLLGCTTQSSTKNTCCHADKLTVSITTQGCNCLHTRLWKQALEKHSYMNTTDKNLMPPVEYTKAEPTWSNSMSKDVSHNTTMTCTCLESIPSLKKAR